MLDNDLPAQPPEPSFAHSPEYRPTAQRSTQAIRPANNKLHTMNKLLLSIVKNEKKSAPHKDKAPYESHMRKTLPLRRQPLQPDIILSIKIFIRRALQVFHRHPIPHPIMSFQLMQILIIFQLPVQVTQPPAIFP